MSLTAEQRTEVIKTHQLHEQDSGSAKVQVSLITSRINYLQDHFKSHNKDHHSRRGLLKLVGRRRRLLEYIKKNDVKEYRALIKELGIRK